MNPFPSRDPNWIDMGLEGEDTLKPELQRSKFHLVEAFRDRLSLLRLDRAAVPFDPTFWYFLLEIGNADGSRLGLLEVQVFEILQAFQVLDPLVADLALR